MSFRQTIHGHNPSDRGFIVKINRKEQMVLISFDVSKIDKRHRVWLNSVKKRVGNLDELKPQPFYA